MIRALACGFLGAKSGARGMSTSETYAAGTSAAEFYAEENLKRRYYYLLDSRGQLFLASTKHRNFATSLKDRKILSLMGKMMRPINEDDRKLLESLANFPANHSPSDYRFVSLCGKEKNFIATEDDIASVCFTDLEKKADDSKDESEVISNRLQYFGGTLSEEFDPKSLVLGDTGRLYHKLKEHRHLSNTIGLLHPSLVQELMSSITVTQAQGAGNSRASYEFVYNGQPYRLGHL